LIANNNLDIRLLVANYMAKWSICFHWLKGPTPSRAYGWLLPVSRRRKPVFEGRGMWVIITFLWCNRYLAVPALVAEFHLIWLRFGHNFTRWLVTFQGRKGWMGSVSRVKGRKEKPLWPRLGQMSLEGLVGLKRRTSYSMRCTKHSKFPYACDAEASWTLELIYTGYLPLENSSQFSSSYFDWHCTWLI